MSENPLGYTSPRLAAGAASTRTESEVRAIRARRNLLEANMRGEGTPEWIIERNATDETAAKMLDYERQTLGLIASLFGAP